MSSWYLSNSKSKEKGDLALSLILPPSLSLLTVALRTADRGHPWDVYPKAEVLGAWKCFLFYRGGHVLCQFRRFLTLVNSTTTDLPHHEVHGEGHPRPAPYTSEFDTRVFDFSSAFNTIQPLQLQEKMQAAGVDDHRAAWIINYLSDRPEYQDSWRESVMLISCVPPRVSKTQRARVSSSFSK